MYNKFQDYLKQELAQIEADGLIQRRIHKECRHTDGQRSGIQAEALMNLGRVGQACRQEEADDQTNQQSQKIQQIQKHQQIRKTIKKINKVISCSGKTSKKEETNESKYNNRK